MVVDEVAAADAGPTSQARDEPASAYSTKLVEVVCLPYGSKTPLQHLLKHSSVAAAGAAAAAGTSSSCVTTA
jgi:hypothetical protein